MRRRWFTFCSVGLMLLCIGAGVAYGVTMRMSLYDPTPQLRFYTVPWLGWVCAVAAATTVALHVWRARTVNRRNARALAGCCPRCGYDLRATPGRCPECGREPATATPG